MGIEASNPYEGEKPKKYNSQFPKFYYIRKVLDIENKYNRILFTLGEYTEYDLKFEADKNSSSEYNLDLLINNYSMKDVHKEGMEDLMKIFQYSKNMKYDNESKEVLNKYFVCREIITIFLKTLWRSNLINKINSISEKSIKNKIKEKYENFIEKLKDFIYRVDYLSEILSYFYNFSQSSENSLSEETFPAYQDICFIITEDFYFLCMHNIDVLYKNVKSYQLENSEENDDKYDKVVSFLNHIYAKSTLIKMGMDLTYNKKRILIENS